MNKKKYRQKLAKKLCDASVVLNGRADIAQTTNKHCAELDSRTAWCYSLVAHWLLDKKVKLA